MVNPILGHHRLCEHTKNFNYQVAVPKEEEELIKLGEPIAPKPPTVDVRGREKLNETKSSAEEKPNTQQPTMSHGPGNGSNNSLWSKTSSKEGAKLFESFNRNLINTMKVRKAF